MLALYVLLGLLALMLTLVLLVLFVPVYGYVAYDGELEARIRVLGIPFTLLPVSTTPADRPKRKAKTESAKPSKAKELMQELTRSFREDGVAATLTYLGVLAEAVGQAIGRVLRSIVVDKLKLEMLIVGEDASDTAVRYGQVCSVLYPTITTVSGVMRVRRRDVRVEPNFLADKSDVRFAIRVHIWVFRLAGAVVALLIRMLLAKDSVTDKEVTNYGKS